MDMDKEQIEICNKYSAKYIPSSNNFKVGISKNIRDGIMPINGLRHPIEGDTTGWYIWAGEEYSDDPDFFIPLHVEHLKDWCPLIIKYLGLPPGYRFLVTDDGYEDIWEDISLLDV